MFAIALGRLAAGSPAFPGLATPRAFAEADSPYRSPYRIEFTLPLEELVGDLMQSERGDPRLEGEVAHEHWYSHRTLERWHAWGPPARAYPPAPGVDRWPVEKRRERVIAVASRYLGYGYQHHHIPDWTPPAHWPWIKSCAGRNGKGVDCSNLTGFVYNLGFGLRMSGDIHRQAEERVAEGPGHGRTTPIRRIELPDGYAERVQALRTGDLLFVRSRGGKVSHVVIWVGPIGRSPDGVPLVIDSHGEDTRDSEGRPIPCGVHLRPFRENSWYNRSASHAHRIFDIHDR